MPPPRILPFSKPKRSIRSRPGLPRRTLPAQVLPVLNLIPTSFLSLGSAQRRSCTWTTPARSLTSPPNIDRARLLFPEKAPSCHKNVTKISYLLQKAAKRRLCLWQVTTSEMPYSSRPASLSRAMGSTSIFCAMVRNSMTSSLRSPLSCFDTYDCGLSRCTVRVPCVRLYLFRQGWLNLRIPPNRNFPM